LGHLEVELEFRAAEGSTHGLHPKTVGVWFRGCTELAVSWPVEV